MKSLSVFVDESGDFGPLDTKSPFYIVSLVFHNQEIDITNKIEQLNESLEKFNLSKNHAIHTGALIRREGDYTNLNVEERRHIFNRLFNFTRTTNISYKCICINKFELSNRFDLNARISRQLANFLLDNRDYFSSFDKIVLYYDNGQTELTSILVSVFNSHYNNVDVRQVYPKDYKLFQSADLICTLKLISEKLKTQQFTKSEQQFFVNKSTFNKTYIKPLMKKSIN